MTGFKRAGLWLLAIIVAGLAPVAAPSQAGPVPRVVADIAPVHSLVAQVMEGVGEPELLLRAGASPHDYSMKPSEARMLDKADIVVWTGPVLTPWLQDAMDVLAPGAERVTFSDLEGVTLLPFRSGALFEAHDQDHESDAHDEEQGIDPHIWLDPQNAAVLVSELARVLSERDPDNADRYQANARRTQDELERIGFDINAIISPLRTRPFLVFHDAYHYFEARFDIHASGAVSLSDGVKPGAHRIRELQKLTADQGVVCVFAEPQFEPRLLQRLTAGTDVRSGILDPIGAGIDPGADHYGQLLRAMAVGLSECLNP
jgi:zinc transport system substrate-binding protein